MSDIFFQPLDQARMQACVNGVAREGMCVVVNCPQTALLNYYGQLFLNHLREAMPNGIIESYNPSDADVLIENFNQLVSAMSVQEALKPGNLSDVTKVWVIKSAHSMDPHEIELLGQLLQQFPGSKVRVVLWMAGAEPSANLLNALGKKMMRWNIAFPNAAQTQTFWNKARATGQEEDVRAMLEQLKLMDHVPAALRAVKQSKSTSSIKPKKKLVFTNPQIVGGVLLVMALLLGSTASVYWLQPEAFAWLKFSTESNEVPEPVATEAKTEVVGVTPPQIAQTPSPTLEPEIVLTPDTPASKIPEVASEKANKVEESAVELPEEALEGKKWAEQLPPQRWLVLHGAYKSFAIAKQVKKAYPGLKNSRVVPVYKPNEPLASFVLASGPFEALQNAEEFTKLSTLPSPGTVRTERNLKSRLTPVVRP